MVILLSQDLSGVVKLYIIEENPTCLARSIKLEENNTFFVISNNLGFYLLLCDQVILKACKQQGNILLEMAGETSICAVICTIEALTVTQLLIPFPNVCSLPTAGGLHTSGPACLTARPT